MRESQFTTAVGKKLPADVYRLKLNLPYTAGVPDCYYSGPGGDLWVEYKYLQHIPRHVDLVGGKDPYITKLQQSWLRARHKEGRNVAVIVGCKSGGVIYSGLEWQETLSRDEFNKRVVSRDELATWITHQTRSRIVRKPDASSVEEAIH